MWSGQLANFPRLACRAYMTRVIGKAHRRVASRCLLSLCALVAISRGAAAAPPTVSFGPRSSYVVDCPTGIAVGGFNGDSRTDIAASAVDADGNPTVIFLFGQASGAFRVQTPGISVAGALLPFDAIAA